VSSPKEIEVKLQLPSASVARLGRVPLLRRIDSSKRKEEQVSVYFDTERLKLKHNGLTLRVRQVDGRYIQTIKSSNGSLFERGEWEIEVPDNRPDLKRADASALRSLGIKKLRKQLRPVFETRVQRTTYPVTHTDCDIAVTIDQGEIGAGDSRLPLCEAEFELKRGDKARLFRLARTFARATSAELAVKSKSERGYEILAGDAIPVVRGAAIAIAPGMPAKAAFQLIAFDCLKLIVANKPAILARDPEGIHQMRIGLRRLRAAISLFSDIIDDAKTRGIKAELRWLTNELGPAREFEVFLTKVVTPLRARRPRPAGIRSMSRELMDRRETAIARALSALSSKRFRELTLNVAAWVELDAGRESRSKRGSTRGRLPIETVACEQLRRRWKKIRKRGRTLAKLDPQARHKLRIQVKKLRYATEFFERLFPGRKREKRHAAFLSALKDIQDCLGELNDIFVHEKLMGGIAKTPVARTDGRARRVFAAGLLTGFVETHLEPVLAAAEHSLSAFEKLEPYWK
jgi:triphosphatase